MGREARQRADARGIPEGVPYILDRYGRPITAGCEIALLQPTMVTLVVRRLTTAVSVDPRAQPLPPGMLRVECTAQMVFLAPKDRPQGEFLLARVPEELIAAGVLRERPEGEAQIVQGARDAAEAEEEEEVEVPELPQGPLGVLEGGKGQEAATEPEASPIALTDPRD